MSILSSKMKPATNVATDEVYVIYGKAGTGKTVLASTFPKTKEAPMLYLDIAEGGISSVATKDKELIQWVPITKFEELDEVLEDVMNGYTVDDKGNKLPLKFSTIVFDSLTQLEYLIKQYGMSASGKKSMTLQLWGQTKDKQEDVYNLLRQIHVKTGAKVVAICHEKEMKDDNNPDFNVLIPSLMTSSSLSLCAKASYVWYTKIEKNDMIDASNNVVTRRDFTTYIDANPYLLSKCRKPMELKVPEKVVNLNYPTFKKNVLDKLNAK